MSSNLPPGITESMIPGNRPEDAEEEAFWDELASRMGLPANKLAERVFDQVANDDNLSKVIELARDIGYERGMQDGRAEEQMAQAAEEAEKAEEEYRREGLI
jgi:predicted DNA-binding ribbon-helix-helix protein